MNLHPSTKYYLYEIELITVYRFLSSLHFPKEQVFPSLYKHLNPPIPEFQFIRDVEVFLKNAKPKHKMKIDYIRYYLASGMPISQIIRVLNTSQATVYKLQKELPTFERRSTMEGFFKSYQEPVDRLLQTAKKLNLFHGYYYKDRRGEIVDPSKPIRIEDIKWF